MNLSDNLYTYLYQALTSQFSIGAFPPGQKFPSQRELCAQYNVGITTVRKVMHMLNEQGYLRTARGQPPIVTYRASREEYATCLVRRRDEIADAYRGLGLLMPALYRAGAVRCQAPELRLFREILRRVSEQMDPPALYRQANAFLTAVLRTLNNQLVIDLELDSENFLHVPYIPFPGVEDPFALTAARLKKWLAAAVNQIEQKQFDGFAAGMARIYQASGKRVDDYFCGLKKYTADAPPTGGDLRWFRIKERSELYTRLAMRIVRRIAGGEFDGRKYLPSIPMLMKEYGVMKNTASRAVTLLNSLGVARTMDKKGSVLSPDGAAGGEGRLDWADDAVRKRISLFLNALQIVSLTAGGCAASFPPAPESLALSVESRLRAAPKNRVSPLSFQLLMHCLIQLSPYHSLKNIFRRLDDQLIWGHYLQAVDASLYPDYTKIAAAMQAVVGALKSRSRGGLQEAFDAAFSLIYQDVCTVLARLPDALKPAR